MNDPFKYDIAISFCHQDEPIASELADALMDQFRVFHYARHQSKLIARDGEAEFSDVFARDARLCVVLHREAWGKSSMTRAEFEAIRSRATDVGYGFTVWVKLDDSPMPHFVPKRFIWGDYQRFGINEIAAAVRALAIESGAAETALTPLDRARRRHRAEEREAARRTFRDSRRGALAAGKAVEELRTALTHHVEQIQREIEGSSMSLATSGHHVVVVFDRVSASVTWEQLRPNNLVDARLTVRYWPFPLRLYGSVPRRTHAREALYLPELAGDDTACWVPEEDPEQVFTSETLAEEIINTLIDSEKWAPRREEGGA